MGKIAIKDINFEALYEGYIWMSDKSEPTVYINKKVDQSLFDSANPFVIEAQLYDGDNGLSYSMKFVDGELNIYRFEVKDTDFNSKENKGMKFIPNRMDKVSKLKFLQYWTPQSDEFCEKMEVLQPSVFVFVGFELKKEEEKK